MSGRAFCVNHHSPKEDVADAAPGRFPEAALAALYDASAEKLVLYGRALGLGHSEAEDVLHDVFAALLKLSAVPDEPDHYVVRAFRNRVFNYRRGWWRRLQREFEATRWFEPTEPVSPQEAAAVACLRGLPIEQREVIVLKVWHGHTFEQIATLQGASPNTVAGRYRYGLQKLRSCLARDSFADSETATDDETDFRSGIAAEPLECVAAAVSCRGHS